ncbi:MAG: hypothetical protein IT459_06650 [Planctomycetes bacterium]|nr:hypothetical protein [Planctomycetota bacterium]
MKRLAAALLFVFCFGGVCSVDAFARPPKPARGGGGQQAERPAKPKRPAKAKKKVLDKFDADGDGKLSPAEKAKAKAWKQAKRERKGKRPV